MKDHLIEHHREMAKILTRHAEALDDDHPAKGPLREIAHHHQKMHKSLASALPEVERETRTQDDGYCHPSDKARETDELRKLLEL